MAGMELYDIMRTTAAVREFTGDPLPDDVLARILDNARFAPSGGNRQGAHIVVVRDMDTRAALAELSLPGARRYIAQQQREQAPWNALTPFDLPPDEVDATEVPARMIDPLTTAAVVLVVCLDLGVVAAVDQDLDRVGVIAGASVYPLVWNILLAARHERFGGTITTMAVAREDGVRELLGVPPTHAVAAVLPLGKPARQVTKLRRKPVGEFVTRERFDGPAF